MREWLSANTPSAVIDKRCVRVSPQWIFFWRRFEGQVVVRFTTDSHASAFDRRFG